jgi:hypothetical protein
MILLNFSHPLTEQQKQRIEEITGQHIERVIDLPVHFENEKPFVLQLESLMAKITLSSEEWQTESILVNPPALNFITALLLADLHGRMGYFPPILRLRPIAGSLPPRYEVAEVLNLQEVRDRARGSRYANSK